MNLLGKLTTTAAVLAFAGPVLAAAPVLTQVSRIEIKQTTRNHVAALEGRDGRTILIALNEVDPYNLRLAAIDADGKELGSGYVPKPESPRSHVSIERSDLNESGEIVVLTRLTVEGMTASLVSHNLTKQTSVHLNDTTAYSHFMDRIRFEGKNIVAVSVDLGHGQGNNNPVLIRLLDEDTGKVLRLLTLDEGVSGKLGIDSDGRLKKLKLLVMGYEIFGLIDVETKIYKELAPPRTQPSTYPKEIETTLGAVIVFEDKENIRLFDTQSLMDGHFDALRTLPLGTQLEKIGDTPIGVAAISSKDGLTLRDLRTNKDLGPLIPIVGQGGRDYVAVSGILRNKANTVAVISQPVDPDSFIPGTILTYVDVSTGEVLRVRKLKQTQLESQLIKVGGNIVAVERTRWARGGPTLVVADVLSNEVITETKDFELIGPAALSNSGGLIGLQETAGKACVANLLKLEEKVCVDDPLVGPGIKSGYQPFSVRNGRILLPLLGPVKNSSYPALGMIELRVD